MVELRASGLVSCRVECGLIDQKVYKALILHNIVVIEWKEKLPRRI
jgi:hypothetical protein